LVFSVPKLDAANRHDGRERARHGGPGDNKESAVARAVSYSAGEVFGQIDVKYEKEPWGWVARAWTATSYLTEPGRPHRVDRVEVKNVIWNPANTRGDFQLPALPGMKVHDFRTGESYIAKAGGWWLPWLAALVAVFVAAVLVVAWYLGWIGRQTKTTP
jgi:hypothetical protein